MQQMQRPVGYHGNEINKPLHSNGHLPNITHVVGPLNTMNITLSKNNYLVLCVHLHQRYLNAPKQDCVCTLATSTRHFSVCRYVQFGRKILRNPG
jgi:hypothetical protein